MSEDIVKRYEPFEKGNGFLDMAQCTKGEWVRFEDYATLEAAFSAAEHNREAVEAERCDD